MNYNVKSFIEDNINLIDSGDVSSLYAQAYNDMYDDFFMRELTKVFEAANIDTFEARKDLLYTLLERICQEATSGGENNLHRLLDNENNWYGFDIHSVIDFLEQMQYNLGVKLIRIDDRIFMAPNYLIVENN